VLVPARGAPRRSGLRRNRRSFSGIRPPCPAVSPAARAPWPATISGLVGIIGNCGFFTRFQRRVARYDIAFAKPAAEVHIGAAFGAERLVAFFHRLAADRAGFGLFRLCHGLGFARQCVLSSRTRLPIRASRRETRLAPSRIAVNLSATAPDTGTTTSAPGRRAARSAQRRIA